MRNEKRPDSYVYHSGDWWEVVKELGEHKLRIALGGQIEDVTRASLLKEIDETVPCVGPRCRATDRTPKKRSTRRKVVLDRK